MVHEEVFEIDRVERRITKPNEFAQRNKNYGERFHEFATLGHYKEAMVEAYRKTQQEQQENDDSTSSH